MERMRKSESVSHIEAGKKGLTDNVGQWYMQH